MRIFNKFFRRKKEIEDYKEKEQEASEVNQEDSVKTKPLSYIVGLCREATFSYYFCTPPPLPSIPKTGFQQYHTSSRPCRYCQKTPARKLVQSQ